MTKTEFKIHFDNKHDDAVDSNGLCLNPQKKDEEKKKAQVDENNLLQSVNVLNKDQNNEDAEMTDKFNLVWANAEVSLPETFDQYYEEVKDKLEKEEGASKIRSVA